MRLGCGSVVNTASDAAPCLSATIADAALRHRVAHFPGGRYTIASAVTMPTKTPVVIEGDGWSETDPGIGTWFHITGTGYVPFSLAGNFGTLFRNVAFSEPQPKPAPGWAPAEHGPIIVALQGSLALDNTMWFAVSRGVQFNAGQRFTASRTFGQSFYSLFEINCAVDIGRIDNLHAWPFWSQDPDVLTWQQAHGVPIISRRNDGPMFTNIFAFGYLAAIQFDALAPGTGFGPPGPTSKFQIANLTADASKHAIYVTGSNTTGQAANVSFHGGQINSPTALAGSIGLLVTGDHSQIDIANFESTQSGGMAVLASGAGTHLAIANLRAANWAADGTQDPAADARDHAVLSLTNAWFAPADLTKGAPGGPTVGRDVQMPAAATALRAATSAGFPITQMTADGLPPSITNGVSVSPATAMGVTARILGTDVVSGRSFDAEVKGTIRRVGTAPAQIVGRPTTTVIGADAGLDGWNVTMTADPTNEVLQINVTQGSTPNPVLWSAAIATTLN